MEYTITDENIQQLINSDKPLLVDCYAEWCGPCKAMMPVVDEVAKEFDGRVNVGKLDADEGVDTCNEYQVMSIPTFLFFKNGQLVDRHIGMIKKSDLVQKLEALL